MNPVSLWIVKMFGGGKLKYSNGVSPHEDSEDTDKMDLEVKQLRKDLDHMRRMREILTKTILHFKQKEYHIIPNDVTHFLSNRMDSDLQDTGLFHHFVRDYEHHCTDMKTMLSNLYDLQQEIKGKEKQSKYLIAELHHHQHQSL
jgi:hypothetical protein